jgi:hypothetical protein
LFRQKPELLAKQYRSIVGETHRLGDLAGARSAVRKALSARPFAFRVWAVFGYLSVAVIKP